MIARELVTVAGQRKPVGLPASAGQSELAQQQRGQRVYSSWITSIGISRVAMRAG